MRPVGPELSAGGLHESVTERGMGLNDQPVILTFDDQGTVI